MTWVSVRAAGFSCRNQTLDHALEVDGKGDEVFLHWATSVVDKDQNVRQSSERTPVMGDVNGQPGRLKAGGASKKGGIRSGDTEFDRKFVVFQGDIPPGGGIAVTPTIWEWDGGADLFNLWGKELVDHGEKIAKAVIEVVKLAQGGVPVIPNKANYILDAVAAGLPDLFALAQAAAGAAGDRPIGYGDNKLPQTLVLTAANVEAVANTSLTEHGPGIHPFNYRDLGNGQGDYTVYLEVQTRNYAEGVMVKEGSNPRVYVILGGAKWWLPSPEWVDRYGPWESIRLVADGTLSGVPDVPVDGTVVREYSAAPVYIVQAGKLRWIPSPDVLRALGRDWGDVRIVPDGSLSGIPRGVDAEASSPSRIIPLPVR